MLDDSAAADTALIETAPNLDLRAAPRFDCPARPALGVTIGGAQAPEVLGVQDISCRGIGLILSQPVDPDTELAILWHFGPVERWRTIRAATVRRAQGRAGWVVGCVLEEPLDSSEVFAFLRYASEIG